MGTVQVAVPTQLALALTVIGAGQAIVGLVMSDTDTLNEQEAVLPDGSVAVKLTGVLPTGNEPPLVA